MASRFWVGNGGTWDSSTTTNWSTSSGGSGGASVPGASDTVTIDANSGTGTITVATDFNITSLTCGAMGMTLDFSVNNNSPTMQTFNCSGTGTRTLNIGSGTWTITGNATNIWNIATTTGLTITGSPTINCTYSGSTGTRSFLWGSTSGGSQTLGGTLNFTSGTDTVILATGTGMLLTTLTWTGFAGTWSDDTSATISLLGNLVIGTSTVVATSTRAINFVATSGTKTITTNGVAINRPITINNTAGATTQLLDNLSMNGASAPTLTLTQGTFNANNFNVTCASFSSANTNTRTLTMGSGTWTLTGTGVVWNIATTTNLTLNSNSSTIKFTDSSSSLKSFNTGETAGTGLTYNNLWLTGGGTGVIQIGPASGAARTNTFNNIRVDAPLTVQFKAGSTTIVSSPTWSGTSGNLNTFQSTTPGTPWNIKVTSGTVNLNYISLQDSEAQGNIPFYAGDDSTNVSGNTNWLFESAPIASGLNAGHDANGRPTIICASETDGVTIVPIFANPTSHGVLNDDNTTGSDNGNNGGNAMLDQNGVNVWLAESSDGSGSLIEVYGNSNNQILINSN